MTTFKTAESPYKSDNTASNMCGFTLMNNQVGVVVAQVCDQLPNVTVTPLPSMIMFANPEDAADYLGFDLTPTSA